MWLTFRNKCNPEWRLESENIDFNWPDGFADFLKRNFQKANENLFSYSKWLNEYHFECDKKFYDWLKYNINRNCLGYIKQNLIEIDSSNVQSAFLMKPHIIGYPIYYFDGKNWVNP